MILRTTEWEGLPPAPGDVVDLPDGERAVVTAVAMGAGIGHWTLTCQPARRIVWNPRPLPEPRDPGVPQRRGPRWWPR